MPNDSRWGLVPRQAAPEDDGFGFAHDRQIWKWSSVEVAAIGALCLGVSPYDIVRVRVLVPGPVPEPEFSLDWPSPYRILGQDGEMRALPPA